MRKIKRQKEFKERIKNKEIIAKIEIYGRTIKGKEIEFSEKIT